MRRSASRRSRTLLLKARPPAMTSPPDRRGIACPAGRDESGEPSPRPPGRQGARGTDRRPGLLGLLRGYEADRSGEPVHDEVLPRGVDATVQEARERREE